MRRRQSPSCARITDGAKIIASSRFSRTTALSASASGGAGPSPLAHARPSRARSLGASHRFVIRFFIRTAAAWRYSGAAGTAGSAHSRKRQTTCAGTAAAASSASSAACRCVASGRSVPCSQVWTVLTSSAMFTAWTWKRSAAWT